MLAKNVKKKKTESPQNGGTRSEHEPCIFCPVFSNQHSVWPKAVIQWGNSQSINKGITKGDRVARVLIQESKYDPSGAPHPQVIEFEFYSRASRVQPCLWVVCSHTPPIKLAPTHSGALGDPLSVLSSSPPVHFCSLLNQTSLKLSMFSFSPHVFLLLLHLGNRLEFSVCVSDRKLSPAHLWIPSSSHGQAANGAPWKSLEWKKKQCREEEKRKHEAQTEREADLQLGSHSAKITASNSILSVWSWVYLRLQQLVFLVITIKS